VEVHVPDPGYTDSAQARARFRFALRAALSLVALLWVVHLLTWGFDLDWQRFGVRPRQWIGLTGVFLAPFLHAGFQHLIANSLPLLLVTAVMLYLYPTSSRIVLPSVYLGPGIAVWLFARDSIHIGASGLVYGLVTYIFFAGVIRRDRRAIAASLLVSFLYGSLAWGVLPIENGVSWETHLAAAIIGAALAFALRQSDVPPRRRYEWEDETYEDEDP
jgi:membrane associated rhomboid family serine protease